MNRPWSEMGWWERATRTAQAWTLRVGMIWLFPRASWKEHYDLLMRRTCFPFLGIEWSGIWRYLYQLKVDQYKYWDLLEGRRRSRQND